MKNPTAIKDREFVRELEGIISINQGFKTVKTDLTLLTLLTLSAQPYVSGMYVSIIVNGKHSQLATTFKKYDNLAKKIEKDMIEIKSKTMSKYVKFIEEKVLTEYKLLK